MNHQNHRLLFLLIALLFSASAAGGQCIEGDCVDGIGTYVYDSGNRFEGQWENGQRQKGDLYYYNGDHYTGPFSNNKRHGRGIYRYRSGNRFEGVFSQGRKVEGAFHYANGNKYVGQYRNNKKNGWGRMHLANGKVLEGYWRENELLRPAGQEDSGHTYAVIVGVADYQHDFLVPDLRYSDDDASLFKQLLTSDAGGAIPAENITLLLDGQATRSSILRAMQRQFGKAGAGDKIIFYFSGHGAPGFFCPYDTDRSVKLLHEEVKQAFRASEATNKLCIADACNSGSIQAARQKKALQMDRATMEHLYRQFQKPGPKVAVLMSSRSNEYSEEGGLLGQGVFSYFLIEGMKGVADTDKDQVVNYAELFDYVHQNVMDFTDAAQHPVLFCNQCKDIPLVYLR